MTGRGWITTLLKKLPRWRCDLLAGPSATQQISRIRLAALVASLLFFAASAKAASDPRFEDFSVAGKYAGPVRRPILDTPRKREYRTRIRAAAAAAPNFAGEFVVVTWGCGTSCEEFAIVSPRTGRVFMPTFSAGGGETLYAPGDNNWERFEHRRDSRLLIVNGKISADNAEPDTHHYFVFDGVELHYLARTKGKPVGNPPIIEPTMPAPAVRGTAAAAETLRTETASSLPSTFVGRWSSSYEECRKPSDGVTQIESNRVDAHESRCAIVKLEHTGDTWTAVTECEGEGEHWASLIQLTVHNDALIIQRDKDPATPMLRCR